MCHSWPEDFSHCFSKPQNSAKEKNLKNVNIIWSNLFDFFRLGPLCFWPQFYQICSHLKWNSICYIYVVRTLNISRIYELFKGKLIPVRNAFFIGQKNVSKSRWNFAELDCIRIYNVANMCVCVLQENVQNKRGK